MLARVEELTSMKIVINQEKMTRGQAVDAVMKAMREDASFADTKPAEHRVEQFISGINA